MDIELGGRAGRPLYLQLRDQLRARLLVGAAAPGSRLPSAREMAALLHVSRNTVFEAYRMRGGGGLVRIVAGQGAFAAPRRAQEAAPAGPRLPWDDLVCAQARAYAHFREHEGRVDLGNRQVISFSSLAPDYHAFENDAFRRALNTVMTNEGSVLLAYGYTRGYEPFRAFVRDYLVGKGLRMDGQEILVTNGFRQAAGLVVETLVTPRGRGGGRGPDLQRVPRHPARAGRPRPARGLRRGGCAPCGPGPRAGRGRAPGLPHPGPTTTRPAAT